MAVPPRISLSDAEKDRLLIEQAAMIERLTARIAELEAVLGRPRKTSSNSHLPPPKMALEKGTDPAARPSSVPPGQANRVRSHPRLIKPNAA
jgi:hypothetical protein